MRPALLWRMKTAIFGLGGGQLALTAIAVGAGALTLGMSWKPALATGLILAMSSTAIVLANLEERGLRQGPVGEAVFGVLLFQDLAVIPLFAILPLLAVHPAAAEAATHAGGIADLPAWQQAGLAMAAIAAVVFGGRYAIRPVFRFIAAARLREIFTAFALLLVVAVAALMELVGLSPALGAFLAGVVLAESEFRRELETDIEPFRGLLLGLFFITVGAGLDFDVVMSKPLLILTLVLGMMGLKAVAMYLTGRALGLTRPEAGVSAVALAQGGEFAFVLISFTVGARILPAEYGKLLSAVVAVSMALTPIAFALYARFVLNRSVAEGAAPEETAFDEAPQVIVAGHGRFGQIVSRLLLANDIPTVTLDSSIEQIELLRRFGREVHYGDAGRLDLLRAAVEGALHQGWPTA
ncbi:MAG TPA: cation:proton antiporter, partial [Phenylobacterium sp.]|nr:cation:proton antiporter [Phenylobacterium sp.]